MRKIVTSALLILASFLLNSTAAMASWVEVGLFGPTRFVRTTGAPNVYEGSFSLASLPAQAKIVVYSGGTDGQDRVSSAIVRVNGETILQPKDFSQQVSRLERPVRFATNNTFYVELRSAPGSYLSIKLIGLVNPPVADDRLITTDEDTPVPITLSGRDPQGNPLTYRVVSGPTHGSPAGNAPDLSYVPSPNFNGSDSFSYVANNGLLDSPPATVSITIRPVNDAPVANDDTATTPEDTPISVAVLANDHDVDGDHLAVVSVAQPANGTASMTNGAVYYSPSPNFYGADSFTYSATDGQGSSGTATVTVTVQPVNDPPSFISTPVLKAIAGNPYTHDVDATDPDMGDVLTFSLRTVPDGMTIDGASGLIQWMPTIVQAGNHSVTVRVTDSGGLFDEQTLALVVEIPNRPPSITSTPVTAATVGVPYGYDVEAADPDAGDVLTYSLRTAPDGMAIDPASGLIQWMPALGQAGNHDVTVRVNDLGGLFDEQSFALSVKIPNQPPSITSTPVTAVVAGVPYNYDVDATDQDVGDTLAYSLPIAPAGMAIDTITGLITWTPIDADVGPHVVTVEVTDKGGLTAKQEFAVVVTNPMVTVPNVVGQPKAQAESELVTAHLTVGATTEAGSDAVPVGSVISQSPLSGTLVLKGTAVALVVSSGSTSRPPAITSTPLMKATVTQSYDYDVEAMDPDAGDVLTYSLVAAPTGMTINPATGLIHWIPTSNDVGYNNVVVMVIDLHGLSATQTYEISVAGTTDVVGPLRYKTFPVASSPNNFGAVDFNDTDFLLGAAPFGAGGYCAVQRNFKTYWTYGTHLVVRKQFILPAGAKNLRVLIGIDNAVQVFVNGMDISNGWVGHEGCPVDDEFVFAAPDSVLVDGMNLVAVRARDYGDQRYLNVRILYDFNGNAAPYAADDRYTVAQDGQLTVPAPGILANDVDAENSTLRTVLQAPPVHGTLKLDSNGAFAYAPTSGFAGADAFTYKANDGTTDSVAATVAITVKGINQPPTITSIPLTVAVVNQPYVYEVDATDPDIGNTLTFSLSVAPTDMTLNSTTGAITWIPTDVQVGNQNVIVRVTDQDGLFAEQSYAVHVQMPNSWPVITSTPVTDAAVGVPYAYDVEATDPDTGDVLTYTLRAAPAGMTIDPANGLIAWTPSLPQVGSNPVTVRVTDRGGLFVEQSFEVAAPMPNRAPTITSVPVTTGTVGAPHAYDVDATDPDVGDVLTYSLTTAPGGMLIDPASGLISWTPTLFQVGSNPVTVRVTDRGGLFAEQDFGIAVSRLNKTPIADNDTYSANLGELLSVATPGVLANDTDPDGDALSAVLGTPPAHGTVDVRADGSFTYTPSPIPPAQPLNARVKWSWTTSSVAPDLTDVIMTPAIVDLNGDGVPDVVFSSTNSASTIIVGDVTSIASGVLRALDGATGAELFSVVDPSLAVNAFGQIAAGDIDGDGEAEIIASDPSGKQLITFESDGTYKWRSSVLEPVNRGGPALADLDGDGKPEIIVGRQVLNSAGTLLWTGTGGTGGFPLGPTNNGTLSCVADIDLDGVPEIIAGNTAYRADGTLKWQTPLPDGFPAVGNFDDDPFAEIVLVAEGKVWLLEHTGTVKWGPVSIPEGGIGGPPTVADFDGDGKAEIGVAGSLRYTVIETDGTVKWTAVTRDMSSNTTGSSVFDFEGDGSAEVVYRDELKLRVYRGTDGTVLFETPMNSGTVYEYPVVADVDADGRAELVIGANKINAYGPMSGLYVFEDAGTGWAATRKIWNQHSYHITNVNEDATIPACEVPNWLVPGLNNFRLNTFGPADQSRTDGFTYRASDGILSSNEATVEIRLAAKNVPPVIASTPVTSAIAGDLYRYAVRAIDPNVGDTLAFSLTTAPTGMTVDQTTGLIQWTPTRLQSGNHTVIVKVQDREGLFAAQEFVVVSAFINHPPIAVDDSYGVNEGSTLEVGGPQSTLSGLPSVPGFHVEVYALVPTPVKIAFDAVGNLYAGFDEGGPDKFNDPGRVHRIGIGGGPVEAYGPEIPDPDAVLLDVTGSVSGVPGTVLVGQGVYSPLIGSVAGIFPDQSIRTVYSTTTRANINDIAIDSRGQLFAVDSGDWSPSWAYRVLRGEGTRLVSAFDLPPITVAFAIDASDQIFVSSSDGWIRSYATSGVPINPAFAIAPVMFDSLAFAKGGAFGESLYGTFGPDGRLFRITSKGVAELVGSGFTGIGGFAFGPDFALYVAECGKSRILRITPIGIAITKNVLANDSDTDGDAMTATLIAGPVQGSLSLAPNGSFAYTPRAGFRGTDTFTYKANDGLLDSNIATVTITVQAVNHPPVLISAPVLAATAGQLYAYDANATDPDSGDTLVFSLPTGPAGMKIDPATGMISWTPTNAQVGTQSVVVRVTDQGGLFVEQSFDIAVVGSPVPVTVPNVLGMPQSQAEVSLATARLTVGAIATQASTTVPAGIVLGQDPLSGFQVLQGTPVALVVSTGPHVPQPVSIRVTPGTPLLLSGQVQQFSATAILDNGSSLALLADVTWQSSNPAVATVLDSTGRVGAAGVGTATISATAKGIAGSTLVTIQQRVSDGTPPVAEITSPADLSVVTGRVPVIGTTSDANFHKYELAIAPAGDPTFTVIATGSAPVVNGTLGTLDPTLLLNGIYEISLTAMDAGGNIVSVSRKVLVKEDMKVGNFTLAFQDLNIPMDCVPLTVNRVYDSRDKRKGDFGIGWRLDVQTIQLQENQQQGLDWAVDYTLEPGPFGFQFPTWTLYDPSVHVVTVRLPDGRLEEFDLTPQPSKSTASPIYELSVAYTARPGTVGTLQAEGNPTLLLTQTEGPLELYDINTEQLFDPRMFVYTTPEGTVYRIDKFDGVKSVACPSGTNLAFGPDGITHSGGKGLPFTRDAQGRITEIADPNGNAHSYAYDGNGDLITHTDPEGNRTQHTYDYRHGMLDIVDPRGVRAIRNEYDDAGRLVSTTDPAGNQVQYAHDLAARTETVTDRLGNVTVHEYDAKGRVTRTTDPLGGVTDRTYDSFGNELTRTDPLKRTTTRTYDVRRNVLTDTNPLGEKTSYTYNSKNAVTSIKDPLGRVTANSYDSMGSLRTTTDPGSYVTGYKFYDGPFPWLSYKYVPDSKTDALGNVTNYEYDSLSRLTKETDALGHAVQYTYDGNGNRLTETRTRTTGAGVETLVTWYEYDKMNRLVKTTRPDGSVTQTVYNEIGKQAQTIDPLGRATSYEYDERGNLVRTLYPDGSAESSTYDAEGRRLTSTDKAGRITQYTYDELGRLVSTMFPDGATTSTTYDLAGQVITSTDARGNTTQFEYDLAGRRTKVIDPLGYETVVTYDAAGNQATVTDANGHTTEYLYDQNNRRVGTVYADGTSDSVAYDGLGHQVAKSDQAGLSTQYEYDALGRLVKVIDALGQETIYGYDEAGNQVSQTDANGHATTFGYDAMGRRVSRTLPLGMTETIVYDLAGNLTAKTDFLGRTTTYTYDLANRLLTKTPDSRLGEPAVSFAYTVTGQRGTMTDASGTTVYTYDNRDRLIEKAAPQGSLIYGYDTGGNVASIESSTGATDVAYTYDVRNRLASVTDANGTTTYAYDPAGSLASFAYPNGVEHHYTYNLLNRLTNLAASSGAGILASYTYTLGPAGNRTSVTEFSGRAASYTYDNLYRLTAETITGDPGGVNGSIGYVYDPVGNRLTRTSTVAGIDPQTFSYDANDRITTESYDANGNTLASGGRTFGYDSDNRLTSADGGLSFLYDGDGSRVARTVGGVTTWFLVDTLNPTGYSQVLEEISGGVVERSYTYGLKLVSQQKAGGVSFYGFDGHGNVRWLADASGTISDIYDYDSFGNILSRTGMTANEYLHAGERALSDSSLYYLRARYYDSRIGNFVSMDDYYGENAEPLTLNKYLYTMANPVNNIDPSGHTSLSEVMTSMSIASILSYGAASGMIAASAIEDIKSRARAAKVLAVADQIWPIAPVDGYSPTHDWACNWFIWKTAEVLNIRTKAGLAGDPTANAIYDIINGTTTVRGWERLNSDHQLAKQYADRGYFVVAATKGQRHGHVAVVVSGDQINGTPRAYCWRLIKDFTAGVGTGSNVILTANDHGVRNGSLSSAWRRDDGQLPDGITFGAFKWW